MKNYKNNRNDPRAPVLAVGALLAVWPEDRRKELAELQELLREIKTVNHGSNALGRITRCIEIAEKLTYTDMATCRQDFFSFLVNQAVTSHPGNIRNLPRDEPGPAS
jgi:hypothetical protein